MEISGGPDLACGPPVDVDCLKPSQYSIQEVASSGVYLMDLDLYLQSLLQDL